MAKVAPGSAPIAYDIIPQAGGGANQVAPTIPQSIPDALAAHVATVHALNKTNFAVGKMIGGSRPNPGGVMRGVGK